MMLRTQKVKLYPNQTMKKVLDDLCDYRRYCWNQGLALWNDMYDASVILADKKQRPNERKVRDELVANKADWQFQLSARCLQLAISDLGKAWQNFFDQAQPDWGKPHFKSKKGPPARASRPTGPSWSMVACALTSRMKLRKPGPTLNSKGPII